MLLFYLAYSELTLSLWWGTSLSTEHVTAKANRVNLMILHTALKDGENICNTLAYH